MRSITAVFVFLPSAATFGQGGFLMFGMRVVIAAGLVAMGACGFGVQPTRFNYQAHLTDGGGAPLTGNHACVFRIYQGGTANGADSGTLKYEESGTFNLVSGFLSHAVGTGVPNGPSLSPAVFATSSDLFLQVAVDVNMVLPRSRLEPVPFAISAAYAANGELRTAIDPSAPGFTTPYVISSPGSYYLAGSLTVDDSHGIDITTGGVTLDLNGYSVSSTAPIQSGVGILLEGNIKNIVIRNGKISGGVVNVGGNSYSGPGFFYAMWYAGGSPSQVRISDIHINGVNQDAIFLGDLNDVTVERCSVEAAGGTAIAATDVSFCQVRDVGKKGIDASGGVSNCTVQSTGDAITGTAVSNCTGHSQTGGGIVALTAMNCYGDTLGNSDGVSANDAINCHGYSPSGFGLYTDESATNCTGRSGANHGLESDRVASNCYGETGGVGKYGLYVIGTANTCGGKNSVGGTEIAIKATIGIGCVVYAGVTDIPAGGKFLGTP